MTKKELEEKVERLERELRLVTHQLNNHVCDRSAPIFITPTPLDGTARPWAWSPFYTTAVNS